MYTAGDNNIDVINCWLTIYVVLNDLGVRKLHKVGVENVHQQLESEVFGICEIDEIDWSSV